jgi:hypothetical protein
MKGRGDMKDLNVYGTILVRYSSCKLIIAYLIKIFSVLMGSEISVPPLRPIFTGARHWSLNLQSSIRPTLTFRFYNRDFHTVI